MSTILALDTCTEACSAALLSQGKEYAAFEEVPREHSQRLLSMVDGLLAGAGISLNDLDVIAYGRGPGSFTGIRICTSMTQGLALGANKPVVGISTLAAMAQSAIDNGAMQVVAAIDARMGEVYWAQYVAENGLARQIGDEQVSAPEAVTLSLDEKQPIIACGTGFEIYPELLTLGGGLVRDSRSRLPDARQMLKLAQESLAQGLQTEVDDLQPVYLRDTVAWKKLPGRE